MLFYVTPVPNAVVKLIPTLSGAETKVLFVIIQKTLGWKDVSTENGRKKRDWISGSQFESETGLSRKWVSTAIDSLSQRDHILVTDEAGAILDTPEKRKGKGRLYFELSPTLLPPCVDYSSLLRRKRDDLAKKLRYTK